MPELVSGSGRCRAYDADADGAVPGEGGAVLLLTTVAQARADGAPVHAVLRGSAVLHNGGAVATISSPSATAQSRTIRAAWARAGADPADAGYLEGHGSGTLSATRSNSKAWPRCSAPGPRPCRSVRSRPTSGTWTTRRASPDWSGPSSACGTASCTRPSTSAARPAAPTPPASAWRSRAPPGPGPTPSASPVSARSASAASTPTASSSARPPRTAPGSGRTRRHRSRRASWGLGTHPGGAGPALRPALLRPA